MRRSVKAAPAADERRTRGASLADRLDAWTRLIGLTFVLVVAGLVVLLLGNQLVLEPRVRDAVEAARVVRLIHESMLDQETGLRGYVATGDAAFLEPYERGRDALPELNRKAQELLTADGTDAALLLELRLTQGAWIDRWTDRALDAGRRPGSVALQGLLLDGQVLFDRYRAAYATLYERLGQERQDALDRQSDAILLTATSAIALTAVMGLLTFRTSRALRRDAAGPLAEILGHLGDVRAGTFAAWPPMEGPAELQLIDRGVAEAADALGRARDQEEEQSARLMTQNKQLAQVLRLAREVAGSLNLRYVLRGVCDAASAISEQRVVVWLRTEDGQALVPRADTAGPGLEPLGLEAVDVGEGLVGGAARYGRVEGHASGILEADPDATEGEVAIPMVVGAEVVGVLQVLGHGVADMPSSTLDVLEALAVQAASAVASARLHEHTTTLAMTDALTHLPNRRQLEVDLATEIAVSTRHARPLAFAMLDVDHFKSYNDVHGHQAGDVALQQLAEVLASSRRTGDTVYRYGGEELCVVMRETTAEQGLVLVDRLRGAVEHHFTGPGQARAITVSAGVAAVPEHGQTAEELIAAADGALYQAKRGGRNRVCRAES